MIGNCLCWAVIFKLIYGGEMRSVHLAGKCRTWYVVRPDGSTIMFKRTQYILPKPFREWLYLGKILSNAKVTPIPKKELKQNHAAEDSTLGNV